jgi:hypothetical protein
VPATPDDEPIASGIHHGAVPRARDRRAAGVAVDLRETVLGGADATQVGIRYRVPAGRVRNGGAPAAAAQNRIGNFADRMAVLCRASAGTYGMVFDTWFEFTLVLSEVSNAATAKK